MKKGIYLVLSLFLSSFIAEANNMLVQNVTTLGNDAVNKTIQVQFDISWDNSWRDEINYDAAWIFMKFKDANGLWQHVQLNQTGFVNGTGTANTVQVTNDKVGCWLYRTGLGSGTFNSTGMQLQWNYGLAGLTNVTGLEVRVFAVEMVYVPEGEFNCVKAINDWAGTRSFTYAGGGNNGNAGLFYAAANTFPIINTRLSPTIFYSDGTNATIRVKGDAGIDTDNNGVIDNSTYPTGYNAFYSYKYEMTEQQYADFFNTLSVTQRTTLGVAGSGITINNGQYFSSTPNKACNNANPTRLLAFADWSGVRPMSFLEFNKASYGPLQPVEFQSGYPAYGFANWPAVTRYTAFTVGSNANSTSTRATSGASYYGILELTFSALEPIVKMNYFSFTTANGNGMLTSTGNSDVSNWNTAGMFIFVDQHVQSNGAWSASNYGFRYVRSAE
jgi:hypothetical protein